MRRSVVTSPMLHPELALNIQCRMRVTDQDQQDKDAGEDDLGQEPSQQ